MNPTQTKLGSYRRPLLEDYLTELRDASILVVGAGGVGCEIVKNLMLCRAKNVTIVDMDTIDISNLNRQFLYTREHINQYKSVVACKRALEIYPEANITSLVCNITEWKPTDLLKYDVVLNALDNTKARVHINYCCIQSGIPLIESGSSGYNGQVFPIIKDATKCYDCDPPPKTSFIPVCSIRQLPERPTHCIAWARMLYELLFGAPNNTNILSDLTIPKLPSLDELSPEVVDKYISDIFTFLFHTEIIALQSLGGGAWSTKEPIKIIKYVDEDHGPYKRIGNFNPSEPAAKVMKMDDGSIMANVHEKAVTFEMTNIKDRLRVYSVYELIEQFRNSVRTILLETPDIIGRAMFSKDDPTCVQFVAASANLRMTNFNIPRISTWDVQSIAGSIIPAIAATNAIVAASQIIQLIHLLKLSRATNRNITNEDVNNSKCTRVWIKAGVMGSTPLIKGNLAQPEKLEPPNPKCTTCQQKSVRVQLKSLEEWTMARFVKAVCIDALGLGMVIVDFNLRNIYDSEEYSDNSSYASQLNKNSIGYYGIKNASILTITDLNEESVQFEIVIEHVSELDEENGFYIIGHYK